MRLSKNLALVLMILLITFTLSNGIALTVNDDEVKKGDEELEWWEDWYRDKNHNKIDDLIEELEPNEKFGTFINYDRHPDENDKARLSKLDLDVKYVYKYIDVICTRNADFSDVKAISKLPHVIMVKLEPKIYPSLDVSARAIKARESEEYSPYTSFDMGFKGGNESYRPSIAIIDSGVDDGGILPNQHHTSLDDLDDDQSTNDPKRIAGVDFTQDESFFAPRDGSYDPDDVDGHGTHCAGIAMGTGGGDDIYVGIAPQARLVDVKIIENYGTANVGDSIAGIEWCISHKNEFNIRVLSCSYGSMFGESDGSDEESQTVNNAVDAGIVVVVAIGNDNFDNNANKVPSPGAADKAITVGSVDDMGTVERSDDRLSTFSFTGPRLDDGDDDKLDEMKPDVVAYGEDIMAPQANSASSYISKSGTSMACPHVAGVVALMLQANPSLNPEQVKKILHDTAEPRGSPSYPDLDSQYNTGYGWGIVDAYEAVDMARGFVEVGIEIGKPAEMETVKGTVEISGSAWVDRGGISKVEVSIDDPEFQDYILTAEGKETWSVSWDTEGWDGERTIYARATSGNYSAVASVSVVVENEKSSGDEVLEGDDSPKINLPFGIGRVSLYAAVAFVAILATIIIAIVAAVLLRRRKMYMRMIEERRSDRELR